MELALDYCDPPLEDILLDSHIEFSISLPQQVIKPGMETEMKRNETKQL